MNKTLSASQITQLFKNGGTIATGYINKTLWISNGQASYAMPGWPKMTAVQLMAILGKDPEKHKSADCTGMIESILDQKPHTVKPSTLRADADGESLCLIVCPGEVLCFKEQYLKRLPVEAEICSFDFDGKRGIVAFEHGAPIAVIMQYRGESKQSVLAELAAFRRLPMLGEGDD